MANNMRIYTMLVAGLILLAGCAGSGSATRHASVEPMPSGISVDSMYNCTVPVSFGTGDFDWSGNSLSLTVYSALRYDAADVVLLQAGDTIVYEGGKPLPIDSIERRDQYVIINGGIETGGVELTPSGGGTYRATTMDDHSVYLELGKRKVRLARDFVMIDCGVNPTDPNDTIRTAQKEYFGKLDGYRREFSPIDTQARIANGEIKEIRRHWIP